MGKHVPHDSVIKRPRKVDPASTTDSIPRTCTVEDVCRHLNISRRRFYELMRDQRFPIPEILPRLGRGPRFRGVDVELYLEGHFATKVAG